MDWAAGPSVLPREREREGKQHVPRTLWTNLPQAGGRSAVPASSRTALRESCPTLWCVVLASAPPPSVGSGSARRLSTGLGPRSFLARVPCSLSLFHLCSPPKLERLLKSGSAWLRTVDGAGPSVLPNGTGWLRFSLALFCFFSLSLSLCLSDPTARSARLKDLRSTREARH